MTAFYGTYEAKIFLPVFSGTSSMNHRKLRIIFVYFLYFFLLFNRVHFCQYVTKNLDTCES